MYNAGFISIKNIGRERHCVLKQGGFNELQDFIDYFDKFWTKKLQKFQDILNEKLKKMKAVVIGEPSGATMKIIMSVYPRHKAIVDKYVAKGEVIGIGPFDDKGNMAIFKTREAAESFVKEDPFILEGIVKSFIIRDWNNAMFPG